MKENIFIMDHPLIQHKISMLRDEKPEPTNSVSLWKKSLF